MVQVRRVPCLQRISGIYYTSHCKLFIAPHSGASPGNTHPRGALSCSCAGPGPFSRRQGWGGVRDRRGLVAWNAGSCAGVQSPCCVGLQRVLRDQGCGVPPWLQEMAAANRADPRAKQWPRVHTALMEPPSEVLPLEPESMERE